LDVLPALPDACGNAIFGDERLLCSACIGNFAHAAAGVHGRAHFRPAKSPAFGCEAIPRLCKPRCVYRLSALRTDLHNLEINWHGHAAKARDRDGKAAPSKTPGLHSCPVCDARISGNKAAVRRLRSGTGGNGHLRSPLAGGSKWKTPRLQLPIWA
jgi:hypothetical protein